MRKDTPEYKRAHEFLKKHQSGVLSTAGEVSKMPINKCMAVFFDKFAAMRPEGDYHWAPPLSKVHEGNYMPLQLTPSHLQYADYGKRRIEAHGNYIEQIVPALK